jgi:chromosome segregation ATPase
MLETVFSTPKGHAAQKLAELQNRHAAIERRITELRTYQAEAETEVKRLQEKLVDALEEDGEAVDGSVQSGSNSQKVHSQLARARARADEPWSEKLQAAQRSRDKAQAEIEQHVRDNFDALAEELTPEALKARDRVLAALSDLDNAASEWHAVEHKFTALLTAIPGTNGQDIPQLSLDTRKLRSGPIVAPIPNSLNMH